MPVITPNQIVDMQTAQFPAPTKLSPEEAAKRKKFRNDLSTLYKQQFGQRVTEGELSFYANASPGFNLSELQGFITGSQTAAEAREKILNSPLGLKATETQVRGQYAPTIGLAKLGKETTLQELTRQESVIKSEFDTQLEDIQRTSERQRIATEERMNRLGLLESGVTTQNLAEIDRLEQRAIKEIGQQKADTLAEIALKRVEAQLTFAQSEIEIEQNITNAITESLVNQLKPFEEARQEARQIGKDVLSIIKTLPSNVQIDLAAFGYPEIGVVRGLKPPSSGPKPTETALQRSSLLLAGQNLEKHRGSNGYYDSSIYFQLLREFNQIFPGSQEDFLEAFPISYYIEPNDKSPEANTIRGLAKKSSSSGSSYDRLISDIGD
jgi:hypothetical protein